MPPVHVLIKPASSACNMACQYCFYRDVSDHREHHFEGMLTLESMEKTIAAAMEFAEGSCTFGFQGGEPTLAGLDFFRKFMELEAQFRTKDVGIGHAIQTNGLHINEEWATFLKEHDYFGYNSDYITFFMQEMAPASDYEGKVYMEEKNL
mgnify:CR=1 FL=1